MIISSAEQGSAGWFSERAGVPSASSFVKLMGSQGKISTQREKYMYTLAGERITGKKEEGYSNGSMQRGVEMEGEARDFFQLITGLAVKEVGFCYKDEAKGEGCSPDGLIMEMSEIKEGLEIKCPDLSTHVEYLLKKKLPTKYFPQVQGSLFVTGLEKWHFFSYYPDMPPVHIEVERDEIWIAKFSKAIKDFNKELDEVHKKLIKVGA